MAEYLMTETRLINPIQSAITDEIFFAFGLRRRGLLRRVFGWLFTLPARRFAKYMAAVDKAIEDSDPPAGCRSMMASLAVDIQAKGVENIPQSGPTILLANHPGAYDSMAVGSLVPRSDLKFIAGRTRLYQVMPHVHPVLIYASRYNSDNMLAIRNSIAHLQQGGILIQFGSGKIEPDPALCPVGDDVFAMWRRSPELFLRKIPATKIVPTIVSGVLLEKFANHPLVNLRREMIDRRRLAEFIQIIQHILFPKTIEAKAMISFGQPFTLDELNKTRNNRQLMPEIISRIKLQLNDHLKWIGEQRQNLQFPADRTGKKVCL